mmetsp:Transcript_96917/g.252626  ORF Transcript_96917/g.252626 Transcript_96917/m.252626 type:complete len:205 (-) Transcript_96917:344-958(-)
MLRGPAARRTAAARSRRTVSASAMTIVRSFTAAAMTTRTSVATRPQAAEVALTTAPRLHRRRMVRARTAPRATRPGCSRGPRRRRSGAASTRTRAARARRRAKEEEEEAMVAAGTAEAPRASTSGAPRTTFEARNASVTRSARSTTAVARTTRPRAALLAATPQAPPGLSLGARQALLAPRAPEEAAPASAVGSPEVPARRTAA